MIQKMRWCLEIRWCLAIVGTLMLLFAVPPILTAQTPPAAAQQGPSAAEPDSGDGAWKMGIRLEMQRVQAVRAQCADEAEEAETGRSSGVRNSEIRVGAAFARVRNDRMACVERADQQLAKLQGVLTTGKKGMAAAGDKFQDDYSRGLQALLTGLQQIATQLQQPEQIRYEMFTAQVDGFQRQLDDFRSRYIRLLDLDDRKKLASTLFQASDQLIASAGAWRREMAAEHTVRLWTQPGDQRAAVAGRKRDAAAAERALQWQAVQRLIHEAAALASAR